MLSVYDIEKRLNDGIERTEREREQCIKWLFEYYAANEMTLNELNDFVFANSDWVFQQIFG